MFQSLFKDIIRFILLILFQVLILNNINMGGMINPYLYILFILLLPFETPRWALLILAFITGFSIDFFSQQHGLHTAACVILGFLRPSVLKIFNPRENYEKVKEPNLQIYGFTWFLKYALLCTFIHHFSLFYLEIFRLSDFFITFGRVLLSTIFTVILIILSQYLFYRR